MVDVHDPVAEADDCRLRGDRVLGTPGVSPDPVAHGVGQVQPGAVAFEHVDDPDRMLVVPEPPAEALGQAVVESLFADVAKGRVPEVVTEPDRLGQVLIQPQGTRDSARHLRDLEGVREASSVVVAPWQHEHLGLVPQPPKRLAVDDPVAVALERGAQPAVGLRTPPGRRVGAGRKRRVVGLLSRLDPSREGVSDRSLLGARGQRWGRCRRVGSHNRF